MLYQWYQKGYTLVPNALLEAYGDLGLSPETFLMVVALLESEGQDREVMGTVERIAQRCHLSMDAVMETLSKLSDQGYLVFEADRLSLQPLFNRLADGMEPASGVGQEEPGASAPVGADLIPQVEQEFGRALSPIEFETLNNWLQTDGYAPDLIRLALKEAVLRQALSLKYMDRILINWERQGIKTAAQAQAALDRFAQQQPKDTEAVYDQIDIPLL